MKIVICGGDGFCGWPTALHLSSLGHEVVIVDNLSRRNIDIELGVESLTPIRNIQERLSAWKEVSGKYIHFEYIDVVRQFDRLYQLFLDFKPHAVMHFAEQCSAPYSMKNVDTRCFTVSHNTSATHNICVAIVASGIDIHLIHLGTMGVYGYTSPGLKIPEGYLKVHIPYAQDAENAKNTDSFEREILYPTKPGSVYHMTKTLDQLIFEFYNRNDKIRITDLHQGIVWGTQTKETVLDERLINRFDYDGDFGTVLNRFLMQAALGYPLTVYGTGGQTRGFINIQDTVNCLELSLLHPPLKGAKVTIRNQITETHRVRELANLVSKLTNVPIQNVPNPRIEDAENDLNVQNRCFLDLGLSPVTLAEGLLTEIYEIAQKYKHRCDVKAIPCVSAWDKNREEEIAHYTYKEKM